LLLLHHFEDDVKVCVKFFKVEQLLRFEKVFNACEVVDGRVDLLYLALHVSFKSFLFRFRTVDDNIERFDMVHGMKISAATFLSTA